MRRIAMACAVAVLLLEACSREKAVEKKDRAVEKVQDAFNVSAPTGSGPTREEIERERFTEEWRKLQSFREAQARQAAAAKASAEAEPALTFVADPKFDEKLRDMNPAVLDSLPLRVPIKGDVSGPTVLKAQILLDRANYSVGAIDGRWGKNSEIAVYWFQQQNGIQPTGDVDEPTFRALVRAAGGVTAFVRHQLTAEDVKGPFVRMPENVYEQAKLDCMCYESVAEKLAETFHTTTGTLELLNPEIDLARVEAGQSILAPNVRPPVPEGAVKDVARIAISVKGNYFHAHDANDNIVFHAPTTVGSAFDPSPTETLKTVKTAFNPHFKYQPKLYSEVPDEQPEADLQPGPNSPVGVVWIALSKPHYGIHGTSDPESIGYASSHGCVRLTNWDARDVARRTGDGAIVQFVDTRH